jgi:CheY-like chemotaxis protein
MIDVQEDVTRDVVLVVEDDKLTMRLLSVMLQNLGFRVMCVEDGKYLTFSLRYFAQVKAILMDMEMPYLDGYKTTRMIRRMLRGTEMRIPIFAVTASGDVDRSYSAGCDLHLVKPVDRDVLAHSFLSYGLLTDSLV